MNFLFCSAFISCIYRVFLLDSGVEFLFFIGIAVAIGALGMTGGARELVPAE